jgi:Na+-translocating ferredoxin:NAD+ oxidoreductase RnfE subunit
MKKASFMTLFNLLFFCIRDILGYGTLTFPGWKSLVVIHLTSNPMRTDAGVFLATIPGSLCLIALLLALYIVGTKRINILLNSPIFKEEGK